MIAAGGDCRYMPNGGWNYGSVYNPDAASVGVPSDSTRWPIISPSAPVGLSFATANCRPHLEFQFETTADDGRPEQRRLDTADDGRWGYPRRKDW